MFERKKRKYNREEISHDDAIIRDMFEETPPLTDAAFSSIVFNSEYRCFKKGDKFEFRPGLNVIVGDQGCGKSTLIKCMTNTDNTGQWKSTVRPVSFKLFDTEKDNPRIVTDLNYSRNPMFTLQSKFCSHGEAILPIVEACKDMSGIILFIDEPESGMSIRSQMKVADAIKKAAEKCQVFVCTHNLYVIKMAGTVLDMERRMWTDADEFIKFQEDGK